MRANLVAMLLAVSSVSGLSCGGGGGGEGPITPPGPAAVASVTVSPTNTPLTIGGTAQLTASTFDASGATLSGRAISWQSSNNAIASVSSGGFVTAVAVGGPVTITATSEGKSGTASVTVTAPVAVASVVVNPPSTAINVGATTQLTASTLDANAAPLTGRVIVWSTSNATIANVSQTGLVTAIASGGPVTITATSEGKSGAASITVNPIPVAIVTISPPASNIFVGATAQLTATTRAADGTTLTGRAVTWSTGSATLASVSQTGLVTGLASGGPITITATSEGVSGTATIGVQIVPIASVVVSPPNSTIANGTTIPLTATALDANSNVLTGRFFAWNSSAPAIASVSTAGVVTANSLGGPVTITATSAGKSGTATITVTGPLPVATVSVTPPTASVIVGATSQLTATTLAGDGSTLTGRAVAWTTSNAALASVSQTGLVTANAPGGPVTITATSEGKSGTAAITVTPVPVASVVVTPPTTSLSAGNVILLTATTLAGNGSTLTGRTVTWTTSNAGVASVSQTGLVSAVAQGGPVTITATSEGKSGTAQITVTPMVIAVATVTVTPTPVAIKDGNTRQLSAVTRDAGGNVLAGRTVTWTTSNASVATVSGTGLVTAVTPGGPVTITATSEGRTGTAAISVYAGVLTGIDDIKTFLDQCPTTDPAYTTIKNTWELRSDGVLVAAPSTCNGPMSTIPIAQLTDELVSMQVLRTAYYMSQGTAGVLPWTSKNLWDWMKTNVSGINLRAAAGQLYCRDMIGGKLYFSQSRQDATQRDFKRTWIGIEASLSFFVHEIRHADSGEPAHTTGCPVAPLPSDNAACDPSYNINNLGAYGVQYWLESNWASGFLGIGIGCAPPATAQQYANFHATNANATRSRFVTGVPPTVTAAIPYGGPCINF